MTSFYVASCGVQPASISQELLVNIPTVGMGEHSMNGCVGAWTLLEVIPAVDGSDGTVGGVGVVPCDSLGVNPACQNGVTSGTTVCGSTGQPSCGAPVTVIGTAEPIDYTVCGEFYAFGFTVVATIYFTCIGIGEVLKTIRRA